MCSRYARWLIIGEIEEFSDIRLPPEPIPATYNAAPNSLQPIVRLSHNGEPKVTLALWGLLPFWSKTAKPGYSTINARAEELAAKAAFREPLKSRRCLIPANCFYEWQAAGTKNKQPYAIAMQYGAPFFFAGLWDRWKAPNGTVIESFTIVTVPPNALMKPIHDRMPCILEPRDYMRWLDPGDPAEPPVDVLKPFPADAMKSWRVDKAVGNVRNDDASLITPATDTPVNENRGMRLLWEEEPETKS